ncbi:MAG: AMP-binding protein [Bacillota bacterium]|nr:AMP-binding protein [Bacillota bacterium]
MPNEPTGWNTCLYDSFEKEINTIPQMLYSSQANFGGRSANMFKDDGQWRIITYNDLVKNVENLAMGLIKIGVDASDFIGIKAHNSAQWTWADLAITFAGGVSVSIYPSLSTLQTATIADHCDMKYLFVDNRKTLFAVLESLHELPTIKGIFVLEKGFQGDGNKIWGMDELMQQGQENRQDLFPVLKARLDALTPDTPGVLVYTSGTTGELKAVLHTHKEVLYACWRGWKNEAMHGHAENYNTVAMSVLPLSHILEKVNSHYGPLLLGATVGFVESPADMMTDIKVIKPTWVTVVPRILSRIYMGIESAFAATEAGKKAWDWAMDVAVRATYALEDEWGCINTLIPFEEQLTGPLRDEWILANNTVYWRIHMALGGQARDLNCGGSMLGEDLHRKFIGMGGWSIGYGYGSTESGAAITEGNPNGNKVGWTSNINPGVEVKVEDDGELLIRGKGIITEYYKNDAVNAESFTPDGWLKTGDIAEFDENNYMRIIDRKKSLIVLDTGKNVPMGRIVTLCDKYALLDQVVVLGQDKKYIAALIVPNLDILVQLFKQKELPFDKSALRYQVVNGSNVCVEVGSDMINHPFVLQAIQTEVDKVNAELESFETIKKFKLLPGRLTEEAGEITPSQKLRMKVIRDKYHAEVKELY